MDPELEPGRDWRERYADGPLASVCDEREWATLAAPHGLYASHWYLSYLEAQPGYVCAYAVIRSADGDLLGALPTYLRQGPDGINPRYDPSEQIWAARPSDVPRDAWFPLLLGGGRASQASAVLVAPHLDAGDERRVTARLLALLDRRAEAGGAATTALMYLDAASTRRVASVRGPAATVLPGGVQMAVPIAWPSFEGYLDQLSTSRRAMVRREQRRYERAGYVTSVEPLAEVLDETAPLVLGIESKHDHPVRSAEFRDRLGRIAEGQGSRAIALCARRSGRLDGVLVAVAHSDSTFYGIAWGGRADAPREAAVYFNITYYAAIEQAVARGCRAVSLGSGALKAKSMRGARPTPTYHVLLRAPAHASLPPETLAEASAEWWAGIRDELTLGDDPLTELDWSAAR
jgi:predicted N-acyltransferase